MLTRILIEGLIKSVFIIFVLLTGFAYLTLLERRFLAGLQHRVGPNRVGPEGFFQPVADGIKLMLKEDIMPASADKVVFTLAPALVAIPALIILAVVPIGGTLHIPAITDGLLPIGEINIAGIINTAATTLQLPFKSLTSEALDIRLGLTDLNVGVLYILAVTSISVYGIALAGWSSNNKYALMGALRSSAQMVSYELAMGLSIIVPILISGSMSLTDVVDAQQGRWFILMQPLAALVFFIAGLAELNRAPFDLLEAEQELSAGYHAEYSGMKFATFFMGEYVSMITFSVIFSTLFLGGYRLFGIEEVLPIAGPFIVFLKVFMLLLLMIWIRATLPRFRYDRLMTFGWKVMLPTALASLIIAALSLVSFGLAVIGLVAFVVIGLLLFMSRRRPTGNQLV